MANGRNPSDGRQGEMPADPLKRLSELILDSYLSKARGPASFELVNAQEALILHIDFVAKVWCRSRASFRA